MTYAVSVRALCEFTAKQGDLDRRFTPAPTAQQGQQGHAQAAARRGGGYRTELTLTESRGVLMVRGRADGYDAAGRRLDEFKTFRGDLTRMKSNHRRLHRAQLECYGAMLCAREGMGSIDLALVYIDVQSQCETVLLERADAQALMTGFAARCTQFAAWALQETAHHASRNEALQRLKFPYAQFRAGQRMLAEAAYKASRHGRCLLVQAPTGIGKTVGTLFPLLKSMGEGRLDKIFYLAAKSTGRQLALDALRKITAASSDPPVRVLDLVAREKACLFPDRSCHGDSCPLAKGFYDRLPGARAAAAAVRVLDQSALNSLALLHEVCPYYLSQEMIRWSDVVIGDYHYYFDEGGLLHALHLEHEWRIGLLVDEAHNLIERGRSMHTATLTQDELHAALRQAPSPVARMLQRLGRRWSDLCDAAPPDYAVMGELPASVMTSLQQAVVQLNDLAAEYDERLHPDLERFHFAALRFCRLAEDFGPHSLFDISGPTLCIRNVIPGPFLGKRFEAAQCAVLFSATLSPPAFYRNLLGVPATAAWIDIPSPFHASQLKVRLAAHIATRWDRRGASLDPIASLVARQFAAEPGNYLVFASSFDYLQNLFTVLAQRNPDIPRWLQHRGMSEGERQSFIARFRTGGRGIGFAVLGGAFSEGVDLPGERLIGAFIATLGLPQKNAVNDAMAGRLQSVFGAGHDYTYLFPGLQKVVQAGGRVIRSMADRGSLYLIDDRYARPAVQRHLPSWWTLETMDE